MATHPGQLVSIVGYETIQTHVARLCVIRRSWRGCWSYRSSGATRSTQYSNFDASQPPSSHSVHYRLTLSDCSGAFLQVGKAGCPSLYRAPNPVGRVMAASEPPELGVKDALFAREERLEAFRLQDQAHQEQLSALLQDHQTALNQCRSLTHELAQVRDELGQAR